MRAQSDESRDPPRRLGRAVAQIADDEDSRRAVLDDPDARRLLRENVRNLSDAQIDAAALSLDASEPSDFAPVPDEEFSRQATLSESTLNALFEARQRASGPSSPDNIAPRPGRARIRADVAERAAEAARVDPQDRSSAETPFIPDVLDLAEPPEPHLDVAAFGEDLYNALANTVNGYTMQIRRGGETIHVAQWEWAQRPGDGARGWNPNRRMHIASVSKFVTCFICSRRETSM